MNPTNQAISNQDRRGIINFEVVRGDTFAPGPIAFKIDNVNEDFSLSTLKMQIRRDGSIMIELTNTSGISVSGNAISWSISATDMLLWASGVYVYDVQKTTSGVVETILTGTILLKQDITAP